MKTISRAGTKPFVSSNEFSSRVSWTATSEIRQPLVAHSWRSAHETSQLMMSEEAKVLILVRHQPSLPNFSPATQASRKSPTIDLQQEYQCQHNPPRNETITRVRNTTLATTALTKQTVMYRKFKSKSNKSLLTSVADRITKFASILQKFIPLTTINPSTIPLIKRSNMVSFRQKQQSTSARTTNRKENRSRTKLFSLPTLGTTSLITLFTLICMETVLLSTMSNCAKTFYMHWNTSNSIFRIDNTDHIIDVNKGNLAFEFDQVHIICPVYEPGTFENETEKYIIYNVSKVEYETCRITNADPRVIAICDKPQKLMFFTITFRPFTPQPGGLEFLPGNDYYFISTSSKDDLYRRIGGRCSTNNMKVVFKVCCATEEKNYTTPAITSIAAGGVNTLVSSIDSSNVASGVNMDNTAVNIDGNFGHSHHNTIGSSTIGLGGQPKPINGGATSINTNVDQFNRIPIQPSGSGIMLSPGRNGGIGPVGGSSNSVNGINIAQYPGHHHIQTGIRINNVPTQQNIYPSHKGNGNGKEIISNQTDDQYINEVGSGTVPINNIGDVHYLSPLIYTNHSNIIQSTIDWPIWGAGTGKVIDYTRISTGADTFTTTGTNYNKKVYPNHPAKNVHTNTDISYRKLKNLNTIHTTTSHNSSLTNANNNKINNEHHHLDKHPNEVVKNEELTYNSGAASTLHINANFLASMSMLTTLKTQSISAFHPLAMLAMVFILALHYLLHSHMGHLKSLFYVR